MPIDRGCIVLLLPERQGEMLEEPSSLGCHDEGAGCMRRIEVVDEELRWARGQSCADGRRRKF